MNEKISAVTQSIHASKKYHAIYRPTIERIVENVSLTHSKYALEEKTRSILHQIWGAYYPIRPNFIRLERKVQEKLEKGETRETILNELLLLHSSTKERFTQKEQFYKEIFSYTGFPSSVVDQACGLNPLMIPWMHLGANTTYYAYDIDTEEIVFLNKIVYTLNITPMPVVRAGDFLTDTFPYADVVFLFKFLPVLAMQQKDIYSEILKKQRCKFLVISFPVKTLGGKEKGMKDFYSHHFISSIEQLSWKYKKIFFPTELVFIVHT